MSDTASPITIRSIAAGGDGVGTLADGRTVFVPRAAPGDRLQLRNVRLHARFARAEIADVLDAGPDRVTPPCPHYVADRCGSCQLMHLSPAAQRAAKARVAGDAFRRIARLDIVDPPVVPAPAELGYRTKITFAVQQGRLGYHPLNEPTWVFDVRDCLLADTALRPLHQAVRATRRHLPSAGARVVLRLDSSRGLHLIVRGDDGDVWTGAGALHDALIKVGIEAVIWWHPEGGNPRAVAGADDPWPATVFEQVNPEVGRIVRRAALDALGDVAGQQAWDLYAGIGESTQELVRRGATVASVESDVRAVRLAESLGPAGPRRINGLVEREVSALPKPDIVITNPPRSGMEARAVAALRAAGPRSIAYVSCDPATLARDVSRLGTGYQLAALTVFDQFPQTAHMECLAVLERQ